MRIEHIAENAVFVYKQSIATVHIYTMVIPTTQGKIEYWMQSGEMIQNVMPDLTKDQHEFLISGITPEEWDDIFGGEDA
jgi:hypothetical protein